MKTFLIYSNDSRDVKYSNKVLQFLAPLNLEISHQHSIPAGANIDEYIDKSLTESNLIIILLTSSLLSDDKELKNQILRAIELSKNKKVKLIPVLLTYCLWEEVPELKSLHIFPLDKEPLIIREGPLEFERRLILLTKEIKEYLSIKTKKKRMGRMLYLLCNRELQVDAFRREFENYIKREKRVPLSCFFHGNALEEPDKLIDRLAEQVILPRFSNYKDASEPILIRDFPLNPTTQYKTKVKRLLAQAIEEEYGAGLTSEMILKIKRNYKILLIQHNLHGNSWRKSTEDILKWYIEEFWGLKLSNKQTTVILFFNVIYPSKVSIWPFSSKNKGAIRRVLESLSEKLGDSCQVFNELTEVRREDVEKFFLSYTSHLLIDKQQILNEIFGKSNFQHMNKVLFILKKHLEQKPH